MDDISIDRLILEIPGLAAEQGEELARLIGAQLAVSTAGPCEFGVVSVTMDADATKAKDASPAHLASSIVAAILRQIG